MPTKIRKMPRNRFRKALNMSKKCIRKIIQNKLSKNIEVLSTSNTFFSFSDPLFSTVSDPEPTWPPKPQKVKKHAPKKSPQGH